MVCQPLKGANGMTGFVCGDHPMYDYGGYLFEVHSYCGPTPLRRDTHDPRKTIPAGFWPVWEEFKKLTPSEKQAHQV